MGIHEILGQDLNDEQTCIFNNVLKKRIFSIQIILITFFFIYLTHFYGYNIYLCIIFIFIFLFIVNIFEIKKISKPSNFSLYMNKIKVISVIIAVSFSMIISYFLNLENISTLSNSMYLYNALVILCKINI